MIRSVSPRNFDWLMFPIICIILAIGVLFIWSASSEKFLFKQLVWIATGLTLFFILLYFDYLSIAHYAYIIYACVIFLLILVLGMGGAVKGSQRWFSIGSFSVQPSEFMKITLVLTLARFLRYKKYGIVLFDIGVSYFLTFIQMVLIMKQPDLGTALVLVPILLSILYTAGIRLYHLFMLIGAGLAISPLVWMFMLKSYQKNEDYWIPLAREGYGLGGRLSQTPITYRRWFGRFVRDRMGEWRTESDEIPARTAYRFYLRR